VERDAGALRGRAPLLETANASIRNRAARAIIPQSFVRMSELVVLHRDPLRFDLLYRSLWRLVYEPELKHDFADADLARAAPDGAVGAARRAEDEDAHAVPSMVLKGAAWTCAGKSRRTSSPNSWAAGSPGSARAPAGCC
jgi:hypothetical protein